MASLGALVAWATGTSGCVASSASRLPQSVAAAVAQHPMRTMESEHLRLYFPQGREDEARRFLWTVEGCAAYLTRAAQVHNRVSDQKMVVILPELPFNNAFVTPRLAGYDPETVISTFNTADVFLLEMGEPPDPAEIACHELTHYVQFQQVAGFSWFLNVAFGAVYTPQLGLDSWFSEGLAVYYETKLQPRTGRLASPFWRGSFAAGFAERRINGGDLHPLKRDFHAGNNYLVGSQFVRFLADRYGEDKLWQVVAVQARSIFFPLWVNLRFWQVYDKTLSTLIDEFADDVAANLHPRTRPGPQRVVRSAGNSARYARARNGTEALITQDRDRPPRLVVHGPDGRLRTDRTLTDILPPRRLAIAAATLTSGLSFSADGGALYFVAIDIAATYQVARLLRYDLASDTLTVVYDDLRGTGGALTPDGKRYLFAQANGDHHDLAALDLGTRSVRTLATQPHGAFVAHPRVSPDGRRVVATLYDGSRFRIALYDASTGALLGIPVDGDAPVSGAVTDPSWIDDQRIVFLGASASSAGFQVWVHDLPRRRTTRLSDAPYLAFEPRAGDGRTVRFLNREGWGWTLDEVALPAAEEPPVAPPPAAPVVAVVPAAPVVAVWPVVEPVGAAPALVEAAAPVPAAPPDGEGSPLVDHPYRQFDHLFVPRLHGPTLQSVGRQAFALGLIVSGNDRLSMHRWTLAGYYQTAGGGSPSILFGYSNAQLAPFTFSLLASQVQVHDVPPVPADPPAPVPNRAFTLFRRDRAVTADVSRAFYRNRVTVGGSFVETYRPDDPSVLVARRRFAGPHVGASYTGAETTPYTGVRRLFHAAVDVAAYPEPWNTAGVGFVDTRAQLATVLPLPLSRRHALALSARMRDLIGLPRAQPLLVAGGTTSAVLNRSSDRPERTANTSTLVPPGVSFVEPLRGFEDYPLVTDRIYIADAAYRYPVIVDWGTASTLALLPALFVRQLDLELFGAAATEARTGTHHLAGGAALTLSLAMWAVPFNLQYQAARRLTDDEGMVHLITLGL